MSSKPIKIGTPWRHPRTGAIIVPFEFDTGERGNRNFSPESFVGMTKEEAKKYITRVIRDHYQECLKRKKNEPAEKAKLNKVISELTGAELTEK